MKIQDSDISVVSRLDLDFGPMGIQVRVRGLPRGVRRQWLLLIHQSLMQLLKEFSLKRASLDAPATEYSVFQQMNQSVSLHQAFKLKPDLGRNRFGFRIRLIRLHLRMTQKDMAKFFGTSRTHLSAVEHGKIGIRRSTMAKWEHMLRYYMKTDLGIPQPDQPLLFFADKRQTFLHGEILRTGEVAVSEMGRAVSLKGLVLRSVGEQA